jgi:plastocyanin
VTARAVAAAIVVAALAAPAAAAGQTVQAVDGTGTPGNPDRWAPANVTIRPGETVTWSFAGTLGFHNVASDPSLTPWAFDNGPPGVAKPPASYRFDTPGFYAFLCQAHGTTMTGVVTVTDPSGAPPPPPPPPPPSQQPWPNDQPAPTLFEVLDQRGPRVTRLYAAPTARGARVWFRLSEAGRVRIAVRRGRRTVRARRANVRSGASAVTVRGRLRPGRYRVEVRAWDLAGNRSALKRARVTVRR